MCGLRRYTSEPFRVCFCVSKDSQEFLLFLLNEIHDEMKPARSRSEADWPDDDDDDDDDDDVGAADQPRRSSSDGGGGCDAQFQGSDDATSSDDASCYSFNDDPRVCALVSAKVVFFIGIFVFQFEWKCPVA